MKTIITLLSVFLLNNILLKAQYSPPIVDEFQITSSSDYETTPTLGNDGISDLVVFTVQEYDAVYDQPGQGDIWYQRLVNGAPSGSAVQVSSGSTDDEINDICGDYIVYTSYDYCGSGSGTIMVYEISTATSYSIRYAEMMAEARIHGRFVVWREGGTFSAKIMMYDLNWLGTDTSPFTIAGPDPPTFDVQIGNQFVVWTERREGQYDVRARDIEDALTFSLTETVLVDEANPSTHGPWVVWSAQEHGSTAINIVARNVETWETREITNNSAKNFYPNISGDLIVWDSDLNGNYDVFAQELSSGEIFQVTSDPDNQYINNVFRDLVAYTDTRNDHNDIYISHLSFFIHIPDPNFEQALIDLGIDSDGTINHMILDRDAEAVTELDVSNPEYNENLPNVSGKIADLTGIEAFLNLQRLYCYYNELVNLDVSNKPSLTALICYYNQLTNLDVSNDFDLTFLRCERNYITNLNVNGCISLTNLWCDVNNINFLDISDCKDLSTLNCSWNQLATLDLSNNTNIYFLSLNYIPSLTEVCVWEMPFPPTEVDVHTEGSLNVCFEADCNGVCENTKIEEYEKEVLSIYPNPSDDEINIEIENPYNATLEIYNISGRLVFSKAIDSKVEKIDISGLSEGMYFVKVRQEQNVRVEKLIVF